MLVAPVMMALALTSFTRSRAAVIGEKGEVYERTCVCGIDDFNLLGIS